MIFDKTPEELEQGRILPSIPAYKPKTAGEIRRERVDRYMLQFVPMLQDRFASTTRTQLLFLKSVEGGAEIQWSYVAGRSTQKPTEPQPELEKVFSGFSRRVEEPPNSPSFSEDSLLGLHAICRDLTSDVRKPYYMTFTGPEVEERIAVLHWKARLVCPEALSLPSCWFLLVCQTPLGSSVVKSLKRSMKRASDKIEEKGIF